MPARLTLIRHLMSDSDLGPCGDWYMCTHFHGAIDTAPKFKLGVVDFCVHMSDL